MRFNSDLLLNDGDEEHLREQYPDIADLIVWPELKCQFQEQEDKARQLKLASRKSSFWAIALIVLSLLTTLLSTSEVFLDTLPVGSDVDGYLAFLAFVLLIGGLAIGKGFFFSQTRKKWLQARRTAERLRQLNFQFQLAYLEQLCSDDPVDQLAYKDARATEFRRVLNELKQPTDLMQVKGDDALGKTWLVRLPKVAPQIPAAGRWQQYLGYYKELRLDWQKSYADSHFDDSPTALPLRGALQEREQAFDLLEAFATVGIVLLQIAALITLSVGENAATATQWIVLASSALALIIVGLHAYKDGTALGDEITRYRHYRSYLAHADARYDPLTSADQASDAVEVMKRVEEAAYFEMREFLIAQSRMRLTL